MSAIGAGLIAAGCLLVLLAGIGLLRFPDVYTRSNAATKAAGLGVACILGGVAFAIGTPQAAVKLSIAVVLQFAAAPVAGHVIGRAAHRSGAPLWEGTWVDDLAGFDERRSAAQPDARDDGGPSTLQP